MRPYDYLIVGSGLFGAVFAHQMKQAGKRCLVIDKRPHMGGNVYCDNVDGIQVHKYGPHIFHTNDAEIWAFVNRFVSFNEYKHAPWANYQGKMIPLPFNLNTFRALWGPISEAEAKEKLAEQVKPYAKKRPKNLEEQALSTVGRDVYETLIKGYTEKQWGKSAAELPAFIIKRLPVSFSTENRYFKDRYQGIPVGGYNKLIDGLLAGVEVKLSVDFFQDREFWTSRARKLVFTGPIDAYFDHQFGPLEYRGLEFLNTRLEIPQFQAHAQVNYTDANTPFTRIIEHKHFEFGQQPHTVITHEYSKTWSVGEEPFYPINDDVNQAVYRKYEALAKTQENVLFGGRLGEYRYYDMHQVIGSALQKAKAEIS